MPPSQMDNVTLIVLEKRRVSDHQFCCILGNHVENTHPNLPTVRGNEVTVLDIIIIADSCTFFIFVSYNNDCGCVTCNMNECDPHIHSDWTQLSPWYGI